MTTPLLHLQNVSLKFTDIEKPILKNISYQIYAGDVIAVLGSNGSGKSSLFKLIDKRYQPSSGKIYLSDKPISDFTSKIYSRKIKTLTQNCHESLFTSLSILENYLITKQQYEPHLLALNKKNEKNYFSEFISQFNINLASKLDETVDRLSGGEKQSLALALSILYPPEILLLDEHTSALDPKSAESIMLLTKKMIEKYKMTCLLITHDLSEAKYCANRILSLKSGQLYKTIENEEKNQLSLNQLLAICY